MELFCWLEVAVTSFMQRCHSRTILRLALFNLCAIEAYFKGQHNLSGRVIAWQLVISIFNSNWPGNRQAGRQKAATCPLQIDKASIPGLVITNYGRLHNQLLADSFDLDNGPLPLRRVCTVAFRT